MSLFCASVVAFAQMVYQGKDQGVPRYIMEARAAQVEDVNLRTYNKLTVVNAYSVDSSVPLDTKLLLLKLSCETTPYNRHHHDVDESPGERSWDYQSH